MLTPKNSNRHLKSPRNFSSGKLDEAKTLKKRLESLKSEVEHQKAHKNNLKKDVAYYK